MFLHFLNVKKGSALGLFIALTLFSLNAHSQCGFAKGDTIMALCGDSVELQVDGDSLITILGDDFNDQSLDAGFFSNGSIDFSEPCSPTPDHSPYAWMGPSTNSPRYLRTKDLNTNEATRICFDLRFPPQESGSPCEGPDLVDEGVALEYSNDGGSTWQQITYFNPDSTCSYFTVWRTFCLNVPPQAQTNSTRFRWYQKPVSGSDFDHWGLDDVQILEDPDNLVYDWGNGPGNNTDSVLFPTDSTDYSVTITDTADNDTCIAEAHVGYAPLDISIQPDSPIVCGGDSARLQAVVEGGTCPYTLHLEDNVGDGWNGASVSVSTNGEILREYRAACGNVQYTFEVETKDTLSLSYAPGSNNDENAFSLIAPSGDTVFSDGPSPNVGTVYQQIVVCPQDTGRFSYNWDPGLSMSDSTAYDPKTGVSKPTSHTVYVQDTLNSFCSDTASTLVDTSEAPSVSIGPDTSFCMDTSLTLTPSKNYSVHLWNDSILTNMLSVDSSFGTPTQKHWLTVTDSNGCQASDTVTLTVLDTPGVDLGADTNLCPSDSIILDPGSFSSYLWDNGSTAQTHPVGAPSSGTKTHSVTVGASNGCYGNSSITIGKQLTPNVDLGPDTTLCASDTITYSTSYSNPVWDDGSTGSTHSIDTSKTGVDSSEHWLMAENSYGCKGKDTVIVTFSICGAVAHHRTDSRIRIMPNPSSKKVRIQVSDKIHRSETQLLIYDQTGKQVLQKELSKEVRKVWIDVSDLPTGTYLLRMEGNGKSFLRKLVVE